MGRRRVTIAAATPISTSATRVHANQSKNAPEVDDSAGDASAAFLTALNLPLPEVLASGSYQFITV